MKHLSLIALLAIALPALADRMPLPANTPASFTAECGSCHLAYPPALLPAKDWQSLMGGLSEHFGSDATVDAKTGQEITDFLTRNAGSSSKLGNAGKPPRITQTARFVRKHDEVPAKLWTDPRVKSAANCEACHRNAAKGSFSERDLILPELRH